MATYYDLNQIRNPQLRRLMDEIMDTVNGHDHDGTNSKLGLVSGTVAAGGIGTSQLATSSVTAIKIAANAIETAKIKNGQVTTEKIHNDGLGAAALANKAVTLAKMNDLARGSVIVGGESNAPSALDCKGSAKILIGDGTDLKSVAVSGDVTIANTGAVSIGAKKISTAMLGDTASANCKAIADPGHDTAIPVTSSGYVELAIGDAAQTNTLAVPTAIGQELTIYAASVDGAGTRTITVASAVNQTGNNTILLDAAGETIVLRAIKVGAALAWRAIVADGATLSTV